MDRALFEDIMDSYVPQFNQDIIDGLTSQRLENAEEYVKNLFEISKSKFRCDFNLVGISQATPEQYFQELTRPRATKKRNYEISEYDFYMVRLHFELDGVELMPRNLLLPFSEGHNLITLKSSLYTLLPVMADPAISVTGGTMFIPTSAAPLTFLRQGYSMRENGLINSAHQITYANKLHRIHDKPGQRGRTIVAKLSLVHYVLALEGFVEGLKYFTNGEVHYGKEINLNDYPNDVYDHYESFYLESNNKPKGWKFTGSYTPHTFKFAVKKSDNSELLQGFIVTVLYVLDHFAHLVNEYDDEDLLTMDFWILALGHIVHGKEVHHSKNRESMDDHLYSVREYFDDNTRNDLERADVYVKDIVGLFVWVVANIRDKIVDAAKGKSMTGKRIVVERYILSNITSIVNKLAWTISEYVQRNGSISAIEAEKRIQIQLKSDAIRGMSVDHGEIEPIQIPGDNAIPKSTQRVCPQLFTGRRVKKPEINRDDKAWHLTAELFAYCSGRGQTKAISTTHGTINLFVTIAPRDGTMHPHSSLIPYVAHTRRIIG